MQNFASVVLWVYIVLLLIGGLIGYLKAKSKVSLITSAVFAALLALTAIPGVLEPAFAGKVTLVILAALLIVFAIRLAKTKKFMPSGLLLFLTVAVLVLRNINF